MIDLTQHADSICCLSNIADRIVYYPLTIEQKVLDIELLPNYIGTTIVDDSVKVKLFDRKQLHLVNNATLGVRQDIGYHPNFKFSNTIFPFLEEGKFVITYRSAKGHVLHTFSATDGICTDSIMEPKQFRQYVDFWALNDSTFVKDYLVLNETRYPIINWYDRNLTLLKEDILPDSVTRSTYHSMGGLSCPFNLLGREIYYHTDLMPTIYEVSSDASPKAIYRFEMGPYTPELYKLKSYEKIDESPYMLIADSKISDNYIFGEYCHKKLFYRVLFNRHSFEKWVIPTNMDYYAIRKNQSKVGIKNDLDGGFDFWPKKVSKSGEIYTWYTVEELKAKVAQSHSEKVKNPKAAKLLKEMLDNLPKDVNVIVAVLKEKIQHTVSKETDKDLERIENYSVNVTEDCIQVYENSNCRATTSRIDGTDYMVAYSAPLHSIDLIALNGIPSFRQIKLETEGPDGVNDISGIFYYEKTFVLRTAEGFCRVDQEGKVVSKWNINDYLGKNKGFGLRFPEQTVAFNVFSTLGFDDQKGLVALPVYQYEKVNGQYPARILVLSCKDWQIVEELDVTYPEKLKQETWLGCLGIIQALPQDDKVIYNFPASSDIFVYDRTTKTTQVHSIATRYTEEYHRCKDNRDPGLGGGYFLPLRYDRLHQCYWRVQQRKIDGGGVAGKPFSVTRLTPDFGFVGEYDMPAKKRISSFTILFTDDKVLFPYLGGEYIGENNIAFYGFKF